MKVMSCYMWVIGVVVTGALLLVAPAAHAQDNPSPVLVLMDVDPHAVSPGGAMTFTLTMENPTQVDTQVNITTTLPSGFELPLDALPVGASYDLRSGTIAWSGILTSQNTRQLIFPGTAPTEVKPDGRLIAYANVRAGSALTRLSAAGWSGLAPSAGFSYTLVTNDASTRIPSGITGGTGDSLPGAAAENGQETAAGTLVRFINQSQGEGPLSYWWDFGDGTSSTKSSPVHTYAALGDYTVRLATVNYRGTGTVEHVVTITEIETKEEQTAGYDFIVNDVSPAVGQPVSFYNVVSPLGVSVRWNFGDSATSHELNPIHIYEQPGVYTVTRVLGEGETAVQSMRVLTVDHSPQASIQVSSSSVSVGELVTFTAYTSAPDVISYYWDFGDGSTARNNRVAYSYSSPGDFLVTLAIGNDFGVDLDTLTIMVSRFSVFLPLVTNGDAVSYLGDVAAESTPVVDKVLEEEFVQEPEPVNTIPDDPLAQQILEAVNAERAAVGLPALSWSAQLARSAQHHSHDMAAYGFTGHYGSNGSSPSDRIQQASYEGDYAGECTAWGFDDIASAVAWWMTSPPHRVIILSTVATEIGGGYGFNPGAPSVHYWTIDFGAR